MNSTLSAPPKVGRKPPVVRQTLTSKYRMLKANPLLAQELTKKVAPNENSIIQPYKTLVKVMEDAPVITVRRGSQPPPSKLVQQRGPVKKSTNLPKAAALPKRGILTQIKEVTTPSKPNHRVTFRTPNNNSRKSILLTSSVSKNSVSTPTMADLSRRLSEWLIKRGKAAGEYTHLKCFGIDSKKRLLATKAEDTTLFNDETDNKENNDDNLNDTFLIEDSAPPDPETLKNLENIAKDALLDLHSLILDGYPSEQCDGWLKLIKQNYKKLEDDAQYWECRAALEQCKGNINSAVECCKTAIIQGAEVSFNKTVILFNHPLSSCIMST